MNRYPDVQTSTLLECARAMYPDLTWAEVEHPRPSKEWIDLVRGDRPGVGDVVLREKGSGMTRMFDYSIRGIRPSSIDPHGLIQHARDIERLRAYAAADRAGESETDVALMCLAARFVDAFPDLLVGTDGPRRLLAIIEEFERDDYREAFVRITGEGNITIDIEIPPRKRRPFKIIVDIGSSSPE